MKIRTGIVCVIMSKNIMESLELNDWQILSLYVLTHIFVGRNLKCVINKSLVVRKIEVVVAIKRKHGIES